jgi:Rrf2 family protein
MLALTNEGETGWLSVSRISATMTIPERFLPSVMTDLVRAGLVESRVGRTGGYRLARPASTISLLDIIRAAEPVGVDRTCILRGGPCGVDGHCQVHDVFSEARKALEDRLQTAVLADATRSRGHPD